MFPDHHTSPYDLLPPLPRIDGPKLEPFDFQGPQNIEFLEHLGAGLHSHVVKVRIKNKEYALKLFRFMPDIWAPISVDTYNKDNHETIRRFADYCEPFNAECRAFGRLRESGHEDLAIRCYGYVLLSMENQGRMMRALGRNMTLSFNGDGQDERDVGDMKPRTRFQDRAIRGQVPPPPIRGILKELGQKPQYPTEARFKVMRRSIVSLQQLGIFRLDIGARQFIDGKLADFSIAITTPHFITNPELNPTLTADWKTAMEYETFRISCSDYWQFDDEVYEFDEGESDFFKRWIQVDGFPGGKKGHKYGTRSKTRRDALLYTFVDPRSYGRETAERIRKRGLRGGASRVCPRPKRYPPVWHYQTTPAIAERHAKRPRRQYKLAWNLVNGRFHPTRSAVVAAPR